MLCINPVFAQSSQSALNSSSVKEKQSSPQKPVVYSTGSPGKPGSGSTASKPKPYKDPHLDGNPSASGREPSYTRKFTRTPGDNTDVFEGYVAPQITGSGIYLRSGHCGCQGFATFYNRTNDTLDVFVKYLTPAQMPTIDDVALPSLSGGVLLPTVVIAPGEDVTLNVGCRGGIQYEAVNRHHRDYSAPRYFIRDYFRVRCEEYDVILKEESDIFKEEE